MPGSDTIYNERELLSRLVVGDEEAFTYIVHRYYPRLLSFAKQITKTKQTAEEIVQEVFLRLWEKRAHMGEIVQLNAWLFRVAANLAFSWLKREALGGKILQQIQTRTSDNPVEEYLDFRESQERLQAAIELLSEQQQKIFKLRKEQGFSNQEIAEIMGISVNTVKNHLVRALKSLREILGNGNPLLVALFILWK